MPNIDLFATIQGTTIVKDTVWGTIRGNILDQADLLVQIRLLEALIATKVTSVPGKYLSSTDVTAELKASWDSAVEHKFALHAPTDARANLIESITVNGVTVPITNKVAQITAATHTSGLINDKGFQTSDDVNSKIRSAGDLKADKSTTYTKAEVDALVDKLTTAIINLGGSV